MDAVRALAWRLPLMCLILDSYALKEAGVSSGICVAMGVLPRVNSVT